MPEYLQHVLELPDGSFVKIAQRLPDGSYAVIARPDDGSCVPCGCEDGGPCDNGCGIFCDGPDCFFGADAGALPSCVQIDLGEFDAVDFCTLSFDRKEIYHIVSVGGIHKLDRVSPSRNVYTSEAPCLVVIETEDIFGGSSFQTITSFRITVEMLVCRSTSSSTACLFVSSVSTSGLPGNFQYTNRPREVGATLGNTSGIGLGCNSNDGEDPIKGTPSIVTVPDNCENLLQTYRAVSCDGTSQIIVDLATYPTGNATVYRAKLNDILYEVTGSWVPFEVTEGYSWVDEECDDDPDLAVWYKAVPCGTLSLSPPEGMRFQSTSPTTDGAVLISRYPFPLFGPNCLVTFAARPTTELADMSEIPGILIVGRDCGNIPQVTSGCLRDPGGPIDIPESPKINTRPPDPMDAVFREFVRRQTGCVGCGG